MGYRGATKDQNYYTYDDGYIKRRFLGFAREGRHGTMVESGEFRGGGFFRKTRGKKKKILLCEK
jgi:hypothetical protein